MTSLKVFGKASSNFFQVFSEIKIQGSVATVHYEVKGPLREIWTPWPPNFKIQEGDELWKKTCLEFFVGPTQSSQYMEWNFSLSGQWAHYSFSDYRKRSETLHTPPTALKLNLHSDTHLEFIAQVELPRSWKGQKLKGHAPIILCPLQSETLYFAISHPSEKPDFHQLEKVPIL